MKVRLYGPTIGQGSFVRVADGMRQGLEAHGVLAGFVPIDALDEDAGYPGHDAEVAVYVGPPLMSSMMITRGWHQHRLCLFSPNSTWVSKSIVDSLTKETPTQKPFVTGFIAPSTWAKKTLEENVNVPVYLWHHGVDARFKPDLATNNLTRICYRSGRFEAIHFASTPMQRKGTRELIAAWCQLVSERKLYINGVPPILDLIVDGNSDDFESVRKEHSKTTEAYESVFWHGRQNLSIEASAELYRRHHVVIQPSRGEAFGMVPLEARACGTPVVMTTIRTGHDDQVLFPRTNYAGVYHIPMGGMKPIDDGPEAMAPELLAEDIADTIEEMFKGWEHHKNGVLDFGNDLRGWWSWAAVTGRWLEQLR